MTTVHSGPERPALPAAVRRGPRRRALPAAALLAATTAMALLSGCETLPEIDAPGDPSAAPGVPGDGRAVSPLDNPDGTRPGLAALTSAAEKAKARAVIEKVAVKGRGPKTGYDRDKFGHAWLDTADGVPLARNGCDTRNDLLKRDGQKVTFRSGSDCVVMSLTLADPYTGKDIAWKKADAAEVQIDHVVPLSYGWQLGAARWPEAKRRQLANDTLNLLPVDGSTNSAKRDSGPASWLPPSKPIRCAYAVRFAQVAVKYELPVTSADKKAMLAQCGG